MIHTSEKCLGTWNGYETEEFVEINMHFVHMAKHKRNDWL